MFPINDIRQAVAAIVGGIVGIALAVLVYEGIPLGPFNALKAIPLIGPVIETITDGRIDRERKEALKGYVQQVELVAARAELEALQKRFDASRKATDGYAILLRDAQSNERALVEQNRIEDQNYEKRLGELGRRCPLNGDDIDYILR
jgi:hypothetical protein